MPRESSVVCPRFTHVQCAGFVPGALVNLGAVAISTHVCHGCRYGVFQWGTYDCEIQNQLLLSTGCLERAELAAKLR